MNKCNIEECLREVRCKGLCHKHYNHVIYHKTIEKQRQYDKSPERRFKKFLSYCKRESIPTNLTFDKWMSIIKDNKCHYCPNELPTHGSGLDRKCPTIGYFEYNVVSCCETCNFTKRDKFSHIEFKVMMDALNEFRKQI